MEDERVAAWSADLQIGTRRGPQARGERTAPPCDRVPLPARSTPINGALSAALRATSRAGRRPALQAVCAITPVALLSASTGAT